MFSAWIHGEWLLTGFTTATPVNLRHSMARRMGQVFPELHAAPIDYVWGGFVDISMNRAPDFGRLKHRNFPGGRLLRMPSLAIGMAYYQFALGGRYPDHRAVQ